MKTDVKAFLDKDYLLYLWGNNLKGKYNKWLNIK